MVKNRIKGDQLTYSSNHVATFGDVENWKSSSFSYKLDGNILVMNLKGSYNKIKVSFEIRIAANGKISTSYNYNNLPKGNVREVGVKYNIDPVFDALSWNRETYWTAYPKDHLSAPQAEIPLYSKITNTYKEATNKPWNNDSKSFYYQGTANENSRDLTRIAKATKEHINEYALLSEGEKWVSVCGHGDVSCRLAKNGNSLDLYLNNEIDYIDLNWGNYQRNMILEGEYNGKVDFYINP